MHGPTRVLLDFMCCVCFQFSVFISCVVCVSSIQFSLHVLCVFQFSVFILCVLCVSSFQFSFHVLCVFPVFKIGPCCCVFWQIFS